MNPNIRNQEHLVGVYRNAVQPLSWLAHTLEAAKALGPRVALHDATKVRLHLLSVGELDNADVANSNEAEKVAEQIEKNEHPSFHSEIEVLFKGLALVRMGRSETRALIIPVKAKDEIIEERRTAIEEIPWTQERYRPEISSFQFRLRIGTVYDPEIEDITVEDALIETIPKRAMLQKGKVKTL